MLIPTLWMALAIRDTPGPAALCPRRGEVPVYIRAPGGFDYVTNS